MPSKNQLTSTIAQGNDNIENILILKSNGSFELVNRKQRASYEAQGEIIVEHEWFVAARGHVGQQVSTDQKYIDTLYDCHMKGWNMYNQTGEKNILSRNL
jgi:hypothetical protein